MPRAENSRDVRPTSQPMRVLAKWPASASEGHQAMRYGHTRWKKRQGRDVPDHVETYYVTVNGVKCRVMGTPASGYRIRLVDNTRSAREAQATLIDWLSRPAEELPFRVFDTWELLFATADEAQRAAVALAGGTTVEVFDAPR